LVTRESSEKASGERGAFKGMPHRGTASVKSNTGIFSPENDGPMNRGKARRARKSFKCRDL